MKRDIVGYGRHVIPVQWPNKARLALNFVVNYEEGAELSPVNGDQYAETYGGEFTLAAKPQGMRNLSMESLFEYGSRTGIWRLMRLFDQNNIPVTFFITGYALTLNPVFCDYLRETNHEIAGHGWRWIDYATIPKEEERKHIQNCIQTIQKLTGKDVNGWYSGRRSEHTRQLLREIGGFIYDSDSYSDDLPYFEHDHLIIPYTLDCNDFRFTTSPGFSMANDFLTHLKYAFTYLYEEKRPALMTIGLHSRISGHPGRCMAIKHFIEFIKTFSNVWIARRIDIAHHWLSQNNSPPVNTIKNHSK